MATWIGHGFVPLAEVSTVPYLVSSSYSPGKEFEINPLDPEVGINWGSTSSVLKISN